jgi:hypothetical protein
LNVTEYSHLCAPLLPGYCYMLSPFLCQPADTLWWYLEVGPTDTISGTSESSSAQTSIVHKTRLKWNLITLNVEKEAQFKSDEMCSRIWEAGERQRSRRDMKTKEIRKRGTLRNIQSIHNHSFIQLWKEGRGPRIHGTMVLWQAERSQLVLNQLNFVAQFQNTLVQAQVLFY